MISTQDLSTLYIASIAIKGVIWFDRASIMEEANHQLTGCLFVNIIQLARESMNKGIRNISTLPKVKCLTQVGRLVR